MPDDSEIVIYGGLAESAIMFDPSAFIFQNKRVSGIWLPAWLAKRGLVHTARTALKARRLIAGELGSAISARLPLQGAAQGIADYAANMGAGKVIFVPADGQP